MPCGESMNGESTGTLNSMLGHPQLQLLRASMIPSWGRKLVALIGPCSSELTENAQGL
jgi:hypothetical protein